jgi:quercetin dioxygenase-like cupin family protein
MVRLQWFKVRVIPIALSPLFVITATACGTAAASPNPTVTPAPPVVPPLTVAPTEEWVTREGIGRGAGNVEKAIQIEAGQTDLRVGKTTLEPGGYLSWHYHNGPALFSVLSGTVTMKHADGTTEDYPAGSSFPGGPPDQAPSMKYIPDPTTK